MTSPGVIDIPAYLEAKIPLDSASLNPRVRRRFRRFLEGLPDPRLLDLGTGTGAMLRRCLALNLKGSPFLIGIDRDARCLDLARKRIAALQEELKGPAAAVRLLRLDLLQAALHRRGDVPAPRPFDCITAHALMDLLPLEPVLVWVRALLRPGGLLYASLNYDGLTRFTPAYGSPAFEAALLADYDRSMEERRAAGLATGGSRSGSRLSEALKLQGFRILARGRSDWRLRPHRPGAGGGEKLLCETLLAMVYREALNRGALPGRGEELERWYRQRLQAAREGRLGLRVRHLDILAARTARR